MTVAEQPYETIYLSAPEIKRPGSQAPHFSGWTQTSDTAFRTPEAKKDQAFLIKQIKALYGESQSSRPLSSLIVKTISTAILEEDSPTITRLLREALGISNTKSNSDWICRMLHLAIICAKYETAQAIVDLMKTQHISFSVICSDGETALHKAIKSTNGYQPKAEALIQNILKEMSSEECSIQNADGKIPLHLAIQNSSDALFQSILDKTLAEKLSENACSGRSPAHDTVANRSFTVIKNTLALVPTEHLVSESREGDTVLSIAVSRKSHQIVQHLFSRALSQNLDLHSSNSFGMPPLHKAIMAGNAEFSLKLIEHSSPNSLARRNLDGDSALHLSARYAWSIGIQSIISSLGYQAKSSLNDQGNTPFSVCLEAQNTLVKKYIDNCASLPEPVEPQRAYIEAYEKCIEQLRIASE